MKKILIDILTPNQITVMKREYARLKNLASNRSLRASITQKQNKIISNCMAVKDFQCQDMSNRIYDFLNRQKAIGKLNDLKRIRYGIFFMLWQEVKITTWKNQPGGSKNSPWISYHGL